VDVISFCNLSYAAMLSSTTEISQQDLNKIKDVHDLWIAKELEGNGS